MTHPYAMSCYLNAAHHWYGFGFSVIPIIPGTKRSAVKWDDWLNKLSPEALHKYWSEHPDHEVGCIVDDELIVLDADSPQSIVALAELEKTFDTTPLLTIKTRKGVHHYFRRAPGTYAKSDSHSSDEHPERIDIKTGRALVVLSPSTGKSIDIGEAINVDELSIASQDFIDAVFIHNGRNAPRPPTPVSSPVILPEGLSQTLRQLNAILAHIDPDIGYEDWLHVLMAVYHETGGSEEGLALANAWSSRGSKYAGQDEIRQKWASFGNPVGHPITVGTLRKMLTDRGIDWIEVCAATEPGFVCVETGQAPTDTESPQSTDHNATRDSRGCLFAQYTLTGHSADLEAAALDEVYVLEPIALLGQWTVLYARHNTGKTLIIIHLLIEAIQEKRIDAGSVYYFNLDDTHKGLMEKTHIAEEAGFHVLCDGYQGFKVSEFIGHIVELCNKGQARGTILVLDTLKKFTDLMDKRKVSQWNEVMRRFVAKGGTIIGLAHVNKKPGADGRSIYAGTSDMIDDADCAYVLDEVSNDQAPLSKVVEFDNKKRRGNVAGRVSFRFSLEDGLSYDELLATVIRVDDAELAAVKQAVEVKSDAEIIAAIEGCIKVGINTKMQLRDAVKERTGCSKRTAIQVIEKYTGTDPETHRWTYSVADRGAKVYRLLDGAAAGDHNP